MKTYWMHNVYIKTETTEFYCCKQSKILFSIKNYENDPIYFINLTGYKRETLGVADFICEECLSPVMTLNEFQTMVAIYRLGGKASLDSYLQGIGFQKT